MERRLSEACRANRQFRRPAGFALISVLVAALTAGCTSELDRPALPPIQAVHCPAGVRQSLPGFGDVNLEEATALVERVTKIVADPRYDGKTLGVISLLSSSGHAGYLLTQLREAIGEEGGPDRTISFGISSYPKHGTSGDTLMRAARSALEEARSLGGDRAVTFYSAENAIEERLRHDIDIEVLDAD